MAGEELINRIVDREAVKGDYDFTVGIIEEIDKMIKDVGQRLAAMGKGPSSSGEARAQTEELVTTNKKLLTVQEQLAREAEKRAQAEERLRAGLTASQAATREQTAALKAQAAATSELVSPYARLAAQVLIAQKAAKDAGATLIELKQKFGENSAEVRIAQAEYDKLQAKGLELTESLKKLDASVGDHRRNVGNYVGALNTLKPALDEVRARLTQMTQQGQTTSKEFAELTRVEGHLAELTSRSAEGYASLAAEVRAAEKVLADMYTAGLSNTKAFEAMDQEVRKLHTDLNEFHKRQQLLENDAPILTTLSFAARGLGGAYAAAMGAQALFADGNEKVEKELGKLVAVMTLLQGLMEVTELLKQKDAVLTAVQAGVEKAYAGVVAVRNAILSVGTAATTANTVATEEQAVASEGAAVAAEAQTAAVEGVAAAEGEATAATVILDTALTALGIGAIIALIVGVVAAFKAWNETTMDEVDALKLIAEAEKAAGDAHRDYLEALNAGGDKNLESLKNQLGLMQAQGRSQAEILAQQQAIAQRTMTITKPQADANDPASQAKLLARYQYEANQFKDAMTQVALAQQKFATTGDDTAKEYADDWKKFADAHKAAMDAYKADFDEGKKANDDYNAARLESDNIVAEMAKMTEEDRTKFALTQAKIRAQGVIDANQKILADEHSTMEARIAALRSTAAAQSGTNQAELTATLADPGLDRTKGGAADQARATAAANEVKIQHDLVNAIAKVREDFRLRDLEATYNYNKTLEEYASTSAEKISQDNKKGLNERLAAYANYVTAQKALIDLDIDNQIAKSPLLTADQRKTLEQQRTTRKAQVDDNAVRAVPTIAKDAIDTNFKGIQTQFDTAGIMAQVAAYEKLNAALKAGKLTVKEYTEAKQKLDNQASTAALTQQTKALEALQAIYRANALDTKDIDKQIAENKLKLIKDVSDADEKAAAKKKSNDQEGAKLTQDLVGKTSDLIFSLMDDQVERQKNALQKQQDAAEKSAAFQIDQVNQMNLSDQDRAARIHIIQAEEQIQKENYARQQRKLDQEKAKFDKAASITRIIEATAVAATEALSYGPVAGEIFAALIIAAGAVELAKVAATPIPAYADGGVMQQTGIARVSERGAEMGILPGGGRFMTPNTESLMYLPGGTRIIPHEEVAGYMAAGYLGDLRAIAGHPDPGGQTLDRLTKAIDKQTREIKQGLQEIDIHNHITVKGSGNWDYYLSKNT